MKIKKEMLYFTVTLERDDNIDIILEQIPPKDIHFPSNNVLRIRSIHLHLFDKVQLRDEQMSLF